MPVLAIRAPKNGGKDSALGMAISAEFGVLPSLSWSVRRAFLIQAMADVGTECLIIDDAQDLNLAHLAFLKEVTDNLAAPPHARQIGLCLVTAHSGKIIPLKEIFSRPDIRLPTISPSSGYRAAFLCGAGAYRRGSPVDPHRF